MSTIVTQTTARPKRQSAPVAPKRPPLPATHPLIVVTDGRENAASAVRVAAALAARLADGAQALAVLEPLDACGSALAEGAIEELELTRAAVTRDAMHRQLGEATRGGPDWPAQVALGRPAPTIAQVAAERRAELVVTGMGRHQGTDRLFGAEGALEVARAGSTPVLAVGPDADGGFRRAVVAVDFAPASVRAAELACRLLAPGGTLSLVHVRSRHELSEPEWEAWDTARGQRVTELFQRLVVALRGGAPGSEPGARDDCLTCAGRRDVTIGTATLVGDPVDELVDYAARVGADLVAVGTHGGGFVERLFVGTVAAELVRRGGTELPECSVLVCPEPGPEEKARAERQLMGTTEALDRGEWRLALDGFWRRNEGRRVSVELDDPALGAQAVSRGYALLGAAYDPHDDRVDLMLGAPGDRRRHLTRSVGGVRSVAVLTAPDGSDLALRVEHGRGQTLVTFMADGAG